MILEIMATDRKRTEERMAKYKKELERLKKKGEKRG